MQTANPFVPVQDPSADGAAYAKTLFARSLEHTLGALIQTGLAERGELETVYTQCLRKIQQGTPEDPLEALARLRGTDEEFMGSTIQRFSIAVASTMTPPPPAVPFSNKLISPSTFYEMFPFLVELGTGLLVPIIFAEDTDAIGVGSINPLAADIFADEIGAAVHKRFEIRPFLTVVRIDYESWSFLTRKHYAL